MRPEITKKDACAGVLAVAPIFAAAGYFGLAGLGTLNLPSDSPAHGPVVARERAVPAPPAAPLSPLAAEAEAVRAEVESLDARVQDGLAQMGRYLKEFEAERRTWVSLDMTVDAARRVNAALLARNRAVLKLYDSRLAEPIGRFRERLKEAPAVYRRLAEERRRNAKEATLDAERKSYELMATLCDSAARLCEQRHREVFGGDTGAPNAIALAETIANMRKYEVVHARWEDTFARYPSSLDDQRMAALFAHLSVYAEDLEAFTNGVEALTDAMRRKAADLRDRPSESDAPLGPSPSTTAQPLANQERPSTARQASLIATKPSTANAAAGTPCDPLQPGVVLDGSLRKDNREVPCRLTIIGRNKDRLSVRFHLMQPEGTVEFEGHGTSEYRWVQLQVDRNPKNPMHPALRLDTWFASEWLVGWIYQQGNQSCSVRFRLPRTGVSTDRVAVAPK